MAISNDEKIKQKIAESLDLLSFTKDQQDKIIQGLMNNVSSAVNISVLDQLSQEEKNELEKLSGNEEATSDYLKNKIKDLPLLIEEVTKETIDNFRKMSGK